MKTILSLTLLLSLQTIFAQNGMHDVCPLKVGAEVPELSVTNEDGQNVELNSILAEKPTVLVFYRGAWCGYCTKHLAELNNAQTDIAAAGYQIIGISPDQAEKLAESNKRAESEINVYSDSDLKAIQAFGLDWKVGDELFTKYKNEYQLDLEEWSGQEHHALPVPAIFIVRDNTIVFQYVNPNYKMRLSAETLLAILNTL